VIKLLFSLDMAFNSRFGLRHSSQILEGVKEGVAMIDAAMGQCRGDDKQTKQLFATAAEVSAELKLYLDGNDDERESRTMSCEGVIEK
jgi:hypothetical protein